MFDDHAQRLLISRLKAFRVLLQTAAFLFMVSSTGCAPREGFKKFQLLDGPNPEIDQDQLALAEYSKRQTNAVTNLVSLAGHTLPAPKGDSALHYWNDVIDAGMLYIDQVCEQYVNALFWFDRARDAAKGNLNTANTAATAAMGVLGTAAPPIALTAVAFGLVNSLIDTNSNQLLYSMEPSAVRVILRKSQQAYRTGVAANQKAGTYRNQASALASVQGYLSLCLPANLETTINNAVGTSTVTAKEPDKKATDDGTSDESSRPAVPALTVNAGGSARSDAGDRPTGANGGEIPPRGGTFVDPRLRDSASAARSASARAIKREIFQLDTLSGASSRNYANIMDTNGAHPNYPRDQEGFTEWLDEIDDESVLQRIKLQMQKDAR